MGDVFWSEGKSDSVHNVILKLYPILSRPHKGDPYDGSRIHSAVVRVPPCAILGLTTRGGIFSPISSDIFKISVIYKNRVLYNYI